MLPDKVYVDWSFSDTVPAGEGLPYDKDRNGRPLA